MNLIFRLTSALVCMGLSSQALACRMQEPLTEDLKKSALVVFVGSVIDYTPRPKFDIQSNAPWKPALIRFKVEKLERGQLPKELSESKPATAAQHPSKSELEVYWVNGTFGESTSLAEFKTTYGGKLRIGLSQADKSYSNFQDKLWITQGACTPPYIETVK